MSTTAQHNESANLRGTAVTRLLAGVCVRHAATRVRRDLLPETLHSTTERYVQEFEELRMRLGMDEYR